MKTFSFILKAIGMFFLLLVALWLIVTCWWLVLLILAIWLVSKLDSNGKSKDKDDLHTVI